MPLRQFLEQDAVFEPADLRAMTVAFEAVLIRLDLKDRTDPLVQLVARKVIRLAQQGERNPAKLYEAASREITMTMPGEKKSLANNLWAQMAVLAIVIIVVILLAAKYLW
jgi:hypothetical protein